MGDEFSVDDILDGFNDPELEFGQWCDEIGQKCSLMALIFESREYTNLLKFRVHRELYKGKIIDRPELLAVFGTIPDKSFDRVELELGETGYLLDTKRGFYQVSEESLVKLSGAILEHSYSHSENKSFKIAGIEYFNHFKKDELSFIDGTYYCSINGEFVKE